MALLAALGVWIPQLARAAPADSTEGPAQSQRSTIIVAVTSDADPKLVEALKAASANLAAQGLVLEPVALKPGQRPAERAAALLRTDDVLGVFWLDDRDDELRVFLMASPTTAYLRRIPIEGSSREAAREAAWLIVESGSMALVSGAVPAMEHADAKALLPEPAPVEAAPEPTPEPKPTATAPSPTASPAPEQRVGGALVLGYLGEGLAAPVPWQSGIAASGVLDVGRHVRLALDYGVLLPWRSGAPTVRWRHRVGARVGPRVALSRRVAMHALVGASVEAMQWRHSTNPQTGWRVLATAGLDVGLTVSLIPALSLWFQPGLGVPLNRFSFVECQAQSTSCEGTARRVVLNPWATRPRVVAGLAWVFR